MDCCLFDKFKVFQKRICVKRYLGIPLLSIRWREDGIALMLFKILPIFKLQCPIYKQIGENIWEAM